MTFNGILQIVVTIGILLLIARPLGLYMANVYEGRPILPARLFGPVERIFYRICGTGENDEMNWKTYAVAMLIFNVLGIVVVYALQRLQAALPLNPQHLSAVSPDSSFNTAASFTTYTMNHAAVAAARCDSCHNGSYTSEGTKGLTARHPLPDTSRPVARIA